MKATENTCSPVVLVLAGGAGSRMRGLGGVLPKSLIAISPTQTALSRILHHLTVIPKQKIVISTAQIWAPQIVSFVDRFREITSADYEIKVEINPDHALGPVSALYRLANLYPADDYLLCLADIVFVENPFLGLTEGVPRNVVLTAQIEKNRGGISEERGGLLKHLYYRVAECPFEAKLDYSNWTGACCIPRAALTGDKPGSEILEAVLNALVDAPGAISIFRTSAFINLNDPDDLRRCWSMNFE